MQAALYEAGTHCLNRPDWLIALKASTHDPAQLAAHRVFLPTQIPKPSTRASLFSIRHYRYYYCN
jgi:hypothetical protein